MYYDAKKKLYREQITLKGKRHVVSGRTKKECKMKLISLSEEIESPVITFAQAADKWETDVLEHHKTGTQRGYRAALRRCVDALGDLNLTEITPAQIKSFLLGMGLAYKTTNNHKAVISLVIQYAISEMGISMINPVPSVKLPKTLAKSTRQPLTKNERDTILESTADEFQLAYLIMYTGCRCGEAIGLQRKDIDMDNNLIHVSKQITHDGNRPVLSELKTDASERSIPLLPKLKERIQELNLSPDDYIVSGPDPLTKSALDKRWKKYCKENGIDIDRHSIRHEFATMLFEAGVDVKTAQTLLGHSNFNTTMNIYTHVREKQIEDAASKLIDYMA